MAAYVDVKKRPCDRCGKLLDMLIQFPTLRLKKKVAAADGSKSDVWEAAHESCTEKYGEK